MIEIKHLTKTFASAGHPVEALKDVFLSIEDGDIFGIIGMSGAGKSTLVRCINMLERPSAGTIEIDGCDLSRLSESELRKKRQEITMIFQNFNLLMQRNCLKNVCFPLELAGVKRAEAREKAMELLRLVGLQDKALAYPAQLSGGQQQRVSIARALAGNPSVILADEPTGALDSKTSREVIDFLIQLNEGGNTIVLITHDNFIAARAKRVIRIQDGKVIYDGPAQGDEIIRAQCFRQEEEGSREAH